MLIAQTIAAIKSRNWSLPFTGKRWRPVKLLHDNAKSHVTMSIVETIYKLRWEVLEHL